MRILTATRARREPFQCDVWSALPTNASRIEIAGGGYVHDRYEAPFTGDFERAADALFAYEIFPPSRMHSYICTSDHRVCVGATIVQRVVLGPVSIETGVRVIEVERTADRAFFAYATLEGHAERGIASFAVLRDGSQQRLEAEAWSRPGNWLTTIGRPISRLLQRNLTREAVASFCRSMS